MKMVIESICQIYSITKIWYLSNMRLSIIKHVSYLKYFTDLNNACLNNFNLSLELPINDT